MTLSTIGSGGVSLHGIPQPDFSFTFILDAGITAADIGKPLSLKAGVDNTVVIAANGADIIGKLTTYEDRVSEGIKVGAVETKGGFKFTVKALDALAQGDYVVGAGSGEVKKGTAGRAYCVALSGSTATVLVI